MVTTTQPKYYGRKGQFKFNKCLRQSLTYPSYSLEISILVEQSVHALFPVPSTIAFSLVQTLTAFTHFNSQPKMPSKDQYQQLPTSEHIDDPEYEAAEAAAQYAKRFNPPTPAPWKRVALIFFVIALFIIAWKMRFSVKQSQIVHADR